MSVAKAEKLQSVISDDLFPNVEHISDVKQVIEVMKEKAQELQPEQVRAILLLKEMGDNKYLHPNKEHPYEKIIEFVLEGKLLVAEPQYFIDTIEALIPKPPKPIVMAEKAGAGKGLK